MYYAQVTLIETLYKKTALPGFNDRNAEDHSIDDVTEELTKLFQTTQRKIKDLSKFGISQQSEVLSKNIQNSLATRTQDLSNSFRKAQGKYMKSKRITKKSDIMFQKNCGSKKCKVRPLFLPQTIRMKMMKI